MDTGGCFLARITSYNVCYTKLLRARSDLAVIGNWKDDIRIDQAAVKGYVNGEFPANGGAHSGRDWGAFDIKAEVLDLCPTNCMWMEGDELKIDNAECTRCMHCINVMPRALRPGLQQGATLLVGSYNFV